tara:strand:+ start:2019 stop:3698 length:1680 start_codon:yes stop_codon:yes gene_type:complete
MKIKKFGHGGMMSDNGKLAIMIKRFLSGGKLYRHGGEFHNAQGQPTNEKGERIPDDPLVAVASDAERRSGAAGDDGSAQTGRIRGGTTRPEQQTGSTIATPEQAELMTQGTGEGTVASFNTEPISPDMSQDQFELAMQSPFVAEQFKGMDIQTPQQLAEAYEGFKSQATSAIRENEEGVANAARELAKTNENFRIKLETLGDNPTDKEIADLMIQQNTDGLLGDLHGAVVDQFLPATQLNAFYFPRYQEVGKRFVTETTINGQKVAADKPIFTSIQDKGIKTKAGMEKLFQDATDAGVDLTKNIAATEDFLRTWFTDSANEEFISTAQGVERMITGGTGINDIKRPEFIKTMFMDAMKKENSTVPTFDQMGEYRQLIKLRGQEAADAFAEREGFDPTRQLGKSENFKVIKNGDKTKQDTEAALQSRSDQAEEKARERYRSMNPNFDARMTEMEQIEAYNEKEGTNFRSYSAMMEDMQRKTKDAFQERKREGMENIKEERRQEFLDEYFKSRGINRTEATEFQLALADRAFERSFGQGGMRVLKRAGKSPIGALSALFKK